MSELWRAVAGTPWERSGNYKKLVQLGLPSGKRPGRHYPLQMWYGRGSRILYKNRKKRQKQPAHQPTQQKTKAAPKIKDKLAEDENFKDTYDGIYKTINVELNESVHNLTMNVYVKTIKGKTISVKGAPEDTVGHMMQQIEGKTRIPKEQQHLVSKGRVLKDERKLEEMSNMQCGIHNGRTTIVGRVGRQSGHVLVLPLLTQGQQGSRFLNSSL